MKRDVKKKVSPPSQKVESAPKEKNDETLPAKKRAKPTEGSGVVDPSW
jgi:hypothetical protein